ncbi:MAG: hypothetical protein K8S54_07115 [Spirochaetia bacterium]|nr:hypothetical protein [Spirochaetia bacterium]
MMTFVTLAALAAALIFFLNVINMPRGRSLPSKQEPPRLNVARALSMKASERPRLCPVCGTLLNQEEYLIAAIFPDPGPNQKRQAHIYGCPHCYLTGGVNPTRLTRVSPEEFISEKETHARSS